MLEEEGVENEPVQMTGEIRKASTGIQGLDEITHGGLPHGRPTLVCGGPGSAKSLLAMQFLVHGARAQGEPGVFVSFEESPADLVVNFSSFAFDLPGLERTKALSIVHVEIDPRDLQSTGQFDLEALFVRLDHALRAIAAKRIALDTLEALFGAVADTQTLRSEIHRLFRWLKDRGITTIITAERGEGQLTRYGLEEYVSDCVIVLDHRVVDQVSTRRLRIVKYRGSLHGTNEYPFLIDEGGIALTPVTSLRLDYEVSSERIATGIAQLDEMLGGQGFYRGSTILVSGTAGAGKTTISAHFAAACCMRGERTLYFSFEESPSQMVRNMRTVGIDLRRWIDRGLLKFVASRASVYGLEMHLLSIHKLVQTWKPRAVVLDPFTNFNGVGGSLDVHVMLTRLIDFLKARGITAMLTSLTGPGSPAGSSEGDVSAWIDAWLLLKEVESSGERNRGLYILKARGIAHSNQIREFVITSRGVELVDVYLGRAGMLMGSARLLQQARERHEMLEATQAQRYEELKHEREVRALEAQMAALRAELDYVQASFSQSRGAHEREASSVREDRVAMAHSRKTDSRAVRDRPGDEDRSARNH
ncbi:circadian clock protein KaiC [Archangium sp.]|uniref:circadian clock protein KaiC n=1 Tax=Archangium sp. TaxID=1872627 RepID=UPI002D73189D|nr:circadian clock protein KaiC [Archangium sp.]HYO58469.1 circadian clock protein KaiC [Archangium sp.]